MKQKKLDNKKIVSVTLFCLMLLLLLEPALRYKVSFAVTQFEAPKISYEQTFVNFFSESPSKPTTPQRAHAPEPSTMVLILSGLGGMVIQFARKSSHRSKG